METESLNVNDAVRERYSDAAKAREAALCCPVDYNPQYLKVIPKEVIERDYGCGDPSEHVREGETVLDLGSGGGKICFIASQRVGASGRVIGVDMNDDMLALARESRSEVSAKVGYDNCEFVKGKIQDLKLDRDRVDQYLRENPIKTEQDFQSLEKYMTELRQSHPMIADNSIDVVVSNCVLNLVENIEKDELFNELHRVLKVGGRAVISDIVSDELVPVEMQNDPDLWSGCISGAYEEAAFLKAFEDAGFYGVELVKRDEKPWQVVDGIEFRSVTVVAYKGKEGECWDHNEAVIYKGPFSRVTDDDGHTFERGERMAVCRKTFEILNREPYSEHFIPVEPHNAVNAQDRVPFPSGCAPVKRPARATKGEDYKLTSGPSDSGCC